MGHSPSRPVGAVPDSAERAAEAIQQGWDSLRQANPVQYEAQRLRMLYASKLTLARLGYDVLPLDGGETNKFVSAIKDYQRVRGVPVTGQFTDWRTYEHIISDEIAFEAVPADLPLTMVITDWWDRGLVTATGPMIQRGDSLGLDGIMIVHVRCDRSESKCWITRQVVYASLELNQDVFDIASWDQSEIITAPLDFFCGRNVLRINRILRKVITTNSPLKSADPGCKSPVLQNHDEVWELADSKRLNAARSAAFVRARDSLSKPSEDLRAVQHAESLASTRHP